MLRAVGEINFSISESTAYLFYLLVFFFVLQIVM